MSVEDYSKASKSAPHEQRRLYDNMNDPTAAEAKQYLQSKEIPQLFEVKKRIANSIQMSPSQGIMTGLIHHKPDNPIDFMEHALWQVRADPSVKVAWDMFIREPPANDASTSQAPVPNGNKAMV